MSQRIFQLKHSSVFIPGAICERPLHPWMSSRSSASAQPSSSGATPGTGRVRSANSTVHHQSLSQGVRHNFRKVNVVAASHVHNRRPIQASEPEERYNTVATPPNSSWTSRHFYQNAGSQLRAPPVALVLIFNDGLVQKCEDQGSPGVHPIRCVFAMPALVGSKPVLTSHVPAPRGHEVDHTHCPAGVQEAGLEQRSSGAFHCRSVCPLSF